MNSVPPPPPARCLQMCVVVPARNESEGVAATLQALCRQIDPTGTSLPPEIYEILVPANTCTDDTAETARGVSLSNPQHRLHVAEVTLDPE